MGAGKKDRGYKATNMLSKRGFQRPLNTDKKPGWRRSYKTQYRKAMFGAMVALQSGPGLVPLFGASTQVIEEVRA